jgi:glycosyltransferase involved in cell wall biosynthesis
MNQNNKKLKVLHITPEPPENFCGVRLVMYRHLIERNPFDLLVVTNRDYCTEELPHEVLKLPYILHRIRRTRLGPRIAKWVTDYENMIWAHKRPQKLDDIVKKFKPDVILALAHNCLSDIGLNISQHYNIPLVGLFLDWFPIMENHYGHRWTCDLLDKRFREFYKNCDLAICTSEGMREELGAHKNAHVVYPMPGKHIVNSSGTQRVKSKKFRLVYVGSIAGFYGRMICSLIEHIKHGNDIELLVVGPNPDWPSEMLEYAKNAGIYLGFKPAEQAARIIQSADALLVIMSFEKEYELFMRTSFTTKFLDYSSYGKPIVLWGPEYCTPYRVVKNYGGAIIADKPDPGCVISALIKIESNEDLYKKLAAESLNLSKTLFDPDRLQNVLVSEIEKLQTNN